MGWRDHIVGKIQIASLGPRMDFRDKGLQKDFTDDEIRDFGVERAVDRAWAKLRETFIKLLKDEIETRDNKQCTSVKDCGRCDLDRGHSGNYSRGGMVSDYEWINDG